MMSIRYHNYEVFLVIKTWIGTKQGPDQYDLHVDRYDPGHNQNQTACGSKSDQIQINILIRYRDLPTRLALLLFWLVGRAGDLCKHWDVKIRMIVMIIGLIILMTIEIKMMMIIWSCGSWRWLLLFHLQKEKYNNGDDDDDGYWPCWLWRNL